MKGIILFAPKNITEYNKIKKISFKVEGHDVWLRIEDSEENLKRFLKILTKGSEIEYTAEKSGLIEEIEVKSFVAAQPEKSNVGKNAAQGWAKDMTCFEDLLTAAHANGIMKISTEMLQCDLVKKLALFKATVTMKNGSVFEGHGDATPENVNSKLIQPHFIRMAETRSIVRALRFATNNAKVAIEETEGATPVIDEVLEKAKQGSETEIVDEE